MPLIDRRTAASEMGMGSPLTVACLPLLLLAVVLVSSVAPFIARWLEASTKGSVIRTNRPLRAGLALVGLKQSLRGSSGLGRGIPFQTRQARVCLRRSSQGKTYPKDTRLVHHVSQNCPILRKIVSDR